MKTNDTNIVELGKSGTDTDFADEIGSSPRFSFARTPRTKCHGIFRASSAIAGMWDYVSWSGRDWPVASANVFPELAAWLSGLKALSYTPLATRGAKGRERP